MTAKPEKGLGSSKRKSHDEPALLWNFLGLQIARRTEILALVAFVLSVSGVLWQVFNYTRGAVVELFPTDQIVITATDKLGRNYKGQDNLVALTATMAYVNGGDVGHNAIIRREYIAFSFGSREVVEHRWYEFGSSDVQDGNFSFKREGEARPFPVNAGSAASHETLFAAWEIDCEHEPKGCYPGKYFIKWDDFLNAVRATNRISITTRAEVYPSKIVRASCEVRLRDWEVKILENEQWLSATCTDDSAGTRPGRKAQPNVESKKNQN
jgi:hypothetical protein